MKGDFGGVPYEIEGPTRGDTPCAHAQGQFFFNHKKQGEILSFEEMWPLLDCLLNLEIVCSHFVPIWRNLCMNNFFKKLLPINAKTTLGCSWLTPNLNF